MEKRHNIVVILTDHQLYYRHATADGRVGIPCFDEFCKDSVRFDNAFSVCPLCGPARRSMINGLYPHNHGQVDNGMTEIGEDEVTYGKVLEKAGYERYYIGKWHAAKGKPADFGFEGFSPEGYNNPYIHDDYKNYLRERGLPEPRVRVEFSESDTGFFKVGETVDPAGFPYLYTYTFGETLTPEDTHECFYLANRACETLRSIADGGADRPFFMCVSFWGPHQPYFPTKKYLDMYDPEKIEMYGSFYDDLGDKPPIYLHETSPSFSRDGKIIIPNPQSKENWQKMLAYAYAENTMCDAAAGRIVAELKNCGLYDDTVVIWSADHGDALGSHGGHIDKNCYLSEEMIRIPLAAHFPEGGGGKVCELPVSNFDIAPTIADYAGVPMKADAQSLRGAALGREKGREYFVSVSHGHFEPHIARAVCYRNFRYIYNKNMTEELYDLDTDPYELKNLASVPEFVAKKEELKKMLAEWQREYGDTNELV